MNENTTILDTEFPKRNISPIQEKKLIDAIVNKKSKTAKEKLAKNYLWLALQIAKQYKHRHSKMNVCNRFEEACIGLFKAIDEVAQKPKITKFRDWTSSYIKKALESAIEDENSTIYNISKAEIKKFNKRTHEIRKAYGEQAVKQFQQKELKRLKEKYNKRKFGHL